MRVVYSDESGLGAERHEPHTVVTGLMLNIDSQWHPVLELVEKSLQQFLGQEDTSNYEIKGRTLYHRIKNGDRKAETLLRDLVSIPRQCLVPVFSGAVDRGGYQRVTRQVYVPSIFKREAQDDDARGTSDMFREALSACLALVDAYVHTSFPKEQVLWIHDRGRYDEDAKEHLKDVRELGRDEFLKQIHEGHYGHTIASHSHIVDTIYFGDSKESRALQLADVFCSTITRHLHSDPAAIEFYEILRPQIVNAGARPAFEGLEAVIEEVGALLKREREGRD